MKNRRAMPTGTARVQAGRDAVIDFEVSSTSDSVNEFITHIHTRYPLRLRRLRSDARWLRKQAAKYGVDPNKVMRSL